MSSSPQELLGSFVIMIIFIFVGMVLLLSVSAPTDAVFESLNASGLTGTAGDYDSRDDVSFLRDQIPMVSYGMFFIGVLQFIFICVRRQEYDQYNYAR